MLRIYITVDVDWAPDWAIKQLREFLVANQVEATWFLTHASKESEMVIQESGLFESGIHPNFMDGSSHGDSIESVIRHCVNLVPNAKSMRTHGLHQSTPIYQAILDHSDVEIDVSMYIPGPSGQYSSIRRLHLNSARSLVRAPFQWEDDLEFFSPSPIWSAAEFLQIHQYSDYVILDLHPIHFALNSSTINSYQSMKRIYPDLKSAPAKFGGELNSSKEVGTRHFMEHLIAEIKDTSFVTGRVSDLIDAS